MSEIKQVYEPHVTGAKILVDTLINEGVNTLFGIPGGAISPVYDTIMDSEITHILMRHEQAAAHAADGYYRASGKIAGAIATSGPGCLNLVTGIATAHKDRSAVLVITGQTPLSRIGTDSFQEVESNTIFRPITKSTSAITSPKLVEYMVKKMIAIGTSCPPGPVHLDFPRNVQTEETKWLPRFDQDTNVFSVDISYNNIQSVGLLLEQSQLPVIIIGGGVIRSQTIQKVYKLCHLLNCPVVTTLMGKGGFPEDDPLFCGMIGSNGSKYANSVVQQADVILALGTRFTDRTVWDTTNFAPRARIVCVNVESCLGTELDNIKILQGDLRRVIPYLIKIMSYKNISPKWKDTEFEHIPVSYEGPSFHPIMVLKTLRAIFPESTIFVTDTGQHQLFAANYLPVNNPSTFITSGGMGCMGFGFPAALGVKIARPDSPVVTITGDGSFLMNIQELATSVNNHIPVNICVFNNGYLGMIRQSEFSCFNRISNVDISPSPDYVKLAESFGAEGITIRNLDDFLEISPNPQETTVIDIPIDPNVCVPSNSYSWK